jgi:hypothetical protein
VNERRVIPEKTYVYPLYLLMDLSLMDFPRRFQTGVLSMSHGDTEGEGHRLLRRDP